MKSSTYYYFLLIGLLFIGSKNEPRPTYYKQLQPILKKHCVYCHTQNGMAPFSLQTYEQVKKMGSQIVHVTSTRFMPPWPANPELNHFVNEKLVPAKDIETIKRWVRMGCEQGILDTLKTDLPSATIIKSNTVRVGFKNPIKVDSNSRDNFPRIILAYTLPQDMDINKFSFFPGNKNLHHFELFVDTIGLNGYASNTDSFINSYSYEATLKFETAFYLTGWLPGENSEDLPTGITVHLPKGSRFYLMQHYSPHVAATGVDSTYILFHSVSEKANTRAYSTFSLHGHTHAQPKPFLIPANTIKTFIATDTLHQDVSVFAILLHAHHLAKTMRVTATLPTGKKIILIDIPTWRFGWQYQYKLAAFKLLPAHTIINYTATYDNTSNNLENPYLPPKDIRYSFASTDEMMELFLYHVPYNKGDEKLLLHW